jgi:maltokinase
VSGPAGARPGASSPDWQSWAEAVLPLVPPYLARQRWARHDEVSGPAPPVVERGDLLPPGEPVALWLVLQVGGGHYQLLVGVRPEDDAPDLGARDTLGTFELAGQKWFAYDGMADAEIVRPLAGSMGVSDVEDVIVRPVGAEQSNTSVVLGQRVILKLFRRLQEGSNPDVEVTTGLDRVGFNHLASPLGVWSRHGFDLAVAQEFLAGGSEGWALALTSLRDLYAGDEEDPAEVGGDFASEARRIGEMTARMHLALAEAFGVGEGDVGDWVGNTRARLADLGLDEDLAGSIDGFLTDMAAAGTRAPVVRVHGDYHLGQVMRTDAGWFVLDFEGEPARPLSERRVSWPPAKDVSGMLRSFDYAASVVLEERDVAQRPGLLERGQAWVERNRGAFLEGYATTDGIAPLMPGGDTDSAEAQAVLRFFEMDKAIYELGYERAHRPDWERIPRAAIERLLAG